MISFLVDISVRPFGVLLNNYVSESTHSNGHAPMVLWDFGTLLRTVLTITARKQCAEGRAKRGGEFSTVNLVSGEPSMLISNQ